jgi:hypothetical protein
MKFELLKEQGNQRFYKCSSPIKVGLTDFVGEVDVQKELNDWWEGFKQRKPDLAAKVKKPDGSIVCVSDAHTHAERLVFLGLDAKGA